MGCETRKLAEHRDTIMGRLLVLKMTYIKRTLEKTQSKKGWLVTVPFVDVAWDDLSTKIHWVIA